MSPHFLSLTNSAGDFTCPPYGLISKLASGVAHDGAILFINCCHGITRMLSVVYGWVPRYTTVRGMPGLSLPKALSHEKSSPPTSNYDFNSKVHY